MRRQTRTAAGQGDRGGPGRPVAHVRDRAPPVHHPRRSEPTGPRGGQTPFPRHRPSMRASAWMRAPLIALTAAAPGARWCGVGTGVGRPVEMVQALVLGIVERITEFLPVSSIGHLTIVKGMLGLRVDDPRVTDCFHRNHPDGGDRCGDLVPPYRHRPPRDCVGSWAVRPSGGRRVRRPVRLVRHRRIWADRDRGLPRQGRDLRTGRNLWVVAAALVVWSVVMAWAEGAGTQRRTENDPTKFKPAR